MSFLETTNGLRDGATFRSGYAGLLSFLAVPFCQLRVGVRDGDQKPVKGPTPLALMLVIVRIGIAAFPSASPAPPGAILIPRLDHVGGIRHRLRLVVDDEVMQ